MKALRFSARSISLAVAVLILAVMLTGVASVRLSAQNGEASVVHSCLKKKGGELKIIGADEDCKKNETPLEWNLQGPSGPQGDLGPQGPQGLIG